MSQVRLRLARFGVANRPYFHLVAIPAQKSRNGLPLEKLGEYDPTPRIRVTGSPARKLVEWNVHRIHHWLNNGAMPTKCVTKLLMRVRSFCKVYINKLVNFAFREVYYHSRINTLSHHFHQYQILSKINSIKI